MSDNEIIKALECCQKPVGEGCKECPLYDSDCIESGIGAFALDLINRQKAEIERLQKKCEKQIPKKPTPHKVEIDRILIGNGYWDKGTTVYKCPTCDSYTTKLYAYCGGCGQALDWSDV